VAPVEVVDDYLYWGAALPGDPEGAHDHAHAADSHHVQPEPAEKVATP
jgi:hypothetical protein